MYSYVHLCAYSYICARGAFVKKQYVLVVLFDELSRACIFFDTYCAWCIYTCISFVWDNVALGLAPDVTCAHTHTQTNTHKHNTHKHQHVHTSTCTHTRIHTCMHSLVHALSTNPRKLCCLTLQYCYICFQTHIAMDTQAGKNAEYTKKQRHERTTYSEFTLQGLAVPMSPLCHHIYWKHWLWCWQSLLCL